MPVLAYFTSDLDLRLLTFEPTPFPKYYEMYLHHKKYHIECLEPKNYIDFDGWGHTGKEKQ